MGRIHTSIRETFFPQDPVTDNWIRRLYFRFLENKIFFDILLFPSSFFWQIFFAIKTGGKGRKGGKKLNILKGEQIMLKTTNLEKSEEA